MSVSITELVIVESLPSHEPQTGALLKESLTVNQRVGIPVTLVKVTTAARLLGLIQHMQQCAAASRGAWVPMLHFEIHGHANRQGLVLASREYLSWEDLAPYVRKLNVSVRNSIVLVLGVCSGAFALTAAANNPFDPSPFYGLIGADGPIPGVLLPDGFEAFYESLLGTGDFVPAVNALRRFLPEYGGYDTARLFQIGWLKYTEACHGEELANRVERIISRASQDQIGAVGGVAAARAMIAEQIRATISHRDHDYEHFIMADIYPEIAHRFPAMRAA